VIRGDLANTIDVSSLVETHLHVPYAYPALRQKLEASAERVLRDYLKDNAPHFHQIEFAEKQIEISLGDGVSVIGRIDLVRRIDSGETTIVDLKSTERAQAEDVTEMQLHVYALGYQELTGRRPDYVEIYEMDERKQKVRSVDSEFIEKVRSQTQTAAKALRTGSLPVTPSALKCGNCDYRGMCTASRAVKPGNLPSTHRTAKNPEGLERGVHSPNNRSTPIGRLLSWLTSNRS
jgi:DNA helicase-2/ATP-dependent DNA helicase PcrA